MEALCLLERPEKGLHDRFKKLRLNVKKRPKNLPFQKDFHEFIDSFGYEWGEIGTSLIMNLDKRNIQPYDVNKATGRLFSKDFLQRLKKQKKIE